MEKESAQEIIGFYGQKREYGCFSNWYPSRFTVHQIEFTSGEQYMMYQKAVLFGDDEIAERIMSTSDVRLIKQLGREVRGYNETIWSGLRQLLVFQGLLAKFGQNDDLKKILLSTGDAILAECSPYDRIWGIGRDLDDKRSLDVNQWRGQNLLGFTLMQVRSVLRDA
jgi:hypothetical protein